MKKVYALLKKNDIGFAETFLVVSIFVVGLFNDFLCCFSASVLFIYLCVSVIKRKKITLYLNLTGISVVIIGLFFFLSVLWAVDGGAALVGGFRFLPVVLFLFIVMIKSKNPENYLEIIPAGAVFMTVLSAIMSFIPFTENLVEIAGRLCGFFQYSNTFALFLLISFIITATKEKINKYEYVYFPVFIFGIMYAGSRTVFVLLILSVVGLLVFSKNKKLKFTVFCISAVVFSVIIAVALLTGNFYSIGRFFTISLKESTFVGRLLYYYDALPVILRNPLGLGYEGYYYMQGSFQTGVYSVRFVHNDFLQMLLDIGWLPTGVFVAAIIKAFFGKGTSFRRRMLILVICIHSFFDFGLQYMAMFMLFILLLDVKAPKEINISTKKAVIVPVCVVGTLLSLYLGVALCFSFRGTGETALGLYPLSTKDDIALLVSETDSAKIEKIADRIIERNEYVSLAYSAKAKVAFSKGDIEKMMVYKEKAIDKTVFSYDEYFDYCSMLIYSVDLYMKAGDMESVKECSEKIFALEASLRENSNRLSYFGKMIKDQPTTEFPDDIKEYIDKLRVFSVEQ